VVSLGRLWLNWTGRWLHGCWRLDIWCRHRLLDRYGPWRIWRVPCGLLRPKGVPELRIGEQEHQGGHDE
jgi:hypothetical protein